jgi:hypothetical protein
VRIAEAIANMCWRLIHLEKPKDAPFFARHPMITTIRVDKTRSQRGNFSPLRNCRLQRFGPNVFSCSEKTKA